MMSSLLWEILLPVSWAVLKLWRGASIAPLGCKMQKSPVWIGIHHNNTFLKPFLIWEFMTFSQNKFTVSAVYGIVKKTFVTIGCTVYYSDSQCTCTCLVDSFFSSWINVLVNDVCIFLGSSGIQATTICCPHLCTARKTATTSAKAKGLWNGGMCGWTRGWLHWCTNQPS